MFILKLALRPWRQSPFNQIFSFFSLGVLLFFGSFLFWIQDSMGPVISQLQTDQVWTAYLKPSVLRKDEDHVVDSIKIALGAAAVRDTEVQLTTMDQFVDQLKVQYPDLVQELLNVGTDAEQIIPRYVTIAGSLPKALYPVIKALPEIENVATSEHRFKHTIGAFITIRWIVRLLFLGLTLVALVGLMHLARLHQIHFSETLSLLKLWGASGVTLKLPALISGLVIGVLGGLFAAITWSILGGTLVTHVKSFSPVFKTMSHPITLGFGVLILGIILGALSSLLVSFRKPSRAGVLSA